MHFLSVGLLYGLGLALAPLLIHLLNRRRFQLVEWAPMKYLKLTVRNNHRRIRMEQLILLLLRTLLIILLIVTVARPVFSSGEMGAIGRWLSGRARVSRIIVLDDGLSMGYRQGGQSALDRGRAAAIELLRATGAQHAVTLLTTEPGSTPLAREVSLDNPDKLVGLINGLRPTDAACDWAGTFSAIDDVLSTATFPRKEVILITDLRRAGWSGDVTRFADRWAAQEVEARIIDVGSRETADVALLRFVQEDPIALPDTPVNLRASIRNRDASAITSAQAVLTIDGKTRPVILPDLAAGATTDLPLSVTFANPGQHTLKLSIPDDDLPGDNARFLTVNVRPKIDVALIDGRPSPAAFESAGDFLELALTVGSGSWRVTHLSDTDPRPPRPDVTALVDVANLTPQAADEYERLVRQGMGLMIFAGDEAEPELYNQRLFRNGAGLLPAKLTGATDGPLRGLVVEGYADSPLSLLAKLAPAALAKIETRRVMGVELPRGGGDSVRVLARWNDAAGTPAVIEKRLGRGRVLLWTTSADRQWTDWQVDPTYVLAVRSAAGAVAWPDSGLDELIAGHPLALAEAPTGAITNIQLLTPLDAAPQPLPALRYGHANQAGVYTLSWLDSNARKQSHQFTASFDEKAADLDPISDAQLSVLLGPLCAEIVPYQGGVLMSQGQGREMWRTLASGLLGLLVVESMLAFWVGRER